MTAMQVFGSVLAIPVGLGSAYSIYRANFSVDTTCATLRTNIISMIDKKIDATARRMLVRHDVETFEKTCGGVDPDAEAAFKALLADEAARPAHAAAVRHVETAVKPEPKAEPVRAEVKEIHKHDLRAAVPAEPAREVKERARDTVKEPPKEVARTADAPAHDVAADARWLDAVRGALVAHAPDKVEAEAAPKTMVLGAPPHPLAPPAPPAAAPAMIAPPIAAAPVAAAPALPPPTQVSEPVGTTASITPDPERLVPPASIPNEPAPVVSAPAPKSTGWLSKVPFVGQALAR